MKVRTGNISKKLVLFRAGSHSIGQMSYLNDSNTVMICAGFVLWQPSCTYLPKMNRLLSHTIPYDMKIIILNQTNLCDGNCIPYEGEGAVLYNGR